MKISKTLSIALAVAMAFVAGNATATGLKLNVSGTVKVQNVYGDDKGTISTHSFNEKDVYLLISNACATAFDYSDGAVTNYPAPLPKDGYIAFNPEGDDDMVEGTFYVTNKSGFYAPLSGWDTNDDYFSFIELDTKVAYNDETSYDDAFHWGFYWFGDKLFQCVQNYTLNSTTGDGSDTSYSKALLYAHDDPYDYGDPNGNDDFLDSYYPFDDENENAFEIGGILTSHFSFKDSDISGGSLSLKGSGNFILYDYYYYGIVSSGNASFNK